MLLVHASICSYIYSLAKRASALKGNTALAATAFYITT
jgi:hypothetical protein